jgi:fructose 1,6-bisphosphatase
MISTRAVGRYAQFGQYDPKPHRLPLDEREYTKMPQTRNKLKGRGESV